MVDRGRHTGEVRVGGGPPLETFGHGVRRGGELVRPEGLQQSWVRDDHPDVRARPLVGAGRVEVRPESGDVDRGVRRGVHAVDVGQRADIVGQGGDRPHVGPRAEDVARRRNRDQPGPFRQQRAVLRDRELTRRYVDFGPAHRDVGPGGGLNPRADVRVVVQPGDHDLVAGPPCVGQRAGQPVGQRGHVRAEDDALRVAAHEVGHGLAAAGHDGAGALAGREGPARVADPGPGRGGDGLDDCLGHLCPGGAVQVGVPVAERRIGGAHRFYVKGHGAHASTSDGNALGRTERGRATGATGAERERAKVRETGRAQGSQSGSRPNMRSRVSQTSPSTGAATSRPAASAGRTCGVPSHQPSNTISGAAGR